MLSYWCVFVNTFAVISWHILYMLLLMINNNNNNNNNNELILLRSCLSAPKVIHILRCSPRVSHPSLQLFDSLLRSTLLSSDHITNITSHHITSLTLTFQTLSGCRRAFRLGMVAWGWDVCLRSHFLPLWLQRRAHSPSRTKSYPDVPALRTHSSRPTCRHGRIPLAMCLKLCLRNSRSGIALAL